MHRHEFMVKELISLGLDGNNKLWLTICDFAGIRPSTSLVAEFIKTLEEFISKTNNEDLKKTLRAIKAADNYDEIMGK